MSLRILYGTTNQAKLDSMKRITADLGMEIIGLKDLDKPIPQVNEDGKDPLENALIKARAYYEAFGMPVFSCDSGLYFEEVAEELQPGTHIRRVHGRELDDEEMIAYYSGLSKACGGRLTARYHNSVCAIIDEDNCFSSMDESLYTESFILSDKPHEKRVPGYPLDALSIDIATGEYYYNLKEKSVDKSAIEQGYKAFWTMVLKSMSEKKGK